ncbi:MAG: hypothetical protein EAX96_06365 [Candidatus Lokiarchaeota archaeon]|nr:hypothetical protein [Candidatus Lokiarchaeota archaeon]
MTEVDKFYYADYLLGEETELIYPEPDINTLYNISNNDKEIDYVVFRINNPNYNLLYQFIKDPEARKKKVKELKESNLPIYTVLKCIKITRVDSQFINLTKFNVPDSAQEKELARFSDLIRMLTKFTALTNVKFMQDDLIIDGYLISAQHNNLEKAKEKVNQLYESFVSLYHALYPQMEFLSFSYKNFKRLLSPFKHLAIVNHKPPSITDDRIVKYQPIKSSEVLKGLYNIRDNIVIWTRIRKIPDDKLLYERIKINELIGILERIKTQIVDSATASIIISAMASFAQTETETKGWSRGTSESMGETDVGNISNITRSTGHSENVKDLDSSYGGVIRMEKSSVLNASEKNINEQLSQTKRFNQELDSINQIKKETSTDTMTSKDAILRERVFTKENLAEIKEGAVNSQERQYREWDVIDNVGLERIQVQDATSQRIDYKGDVLHINNPLSRIGTVAKTGETSPYLKDYGLDGLQQGGSIARTGSLDADAYVGYDGAVGFEGGLKVTGGLGAGSNRVEASARFYTQQELNWGVKGSSNLSDDFIYYQKAEGIVAQFDDSILHQSDAITKFGSETITMDKGITSQEISVADRIKDLQTFSSSSEDLRINSYSEMRDLEQLRSSSSGIESSDSSIQNQQLINEQINSTKFQEIRNQYFGKEYSYGDSATTSISHQLGTSINKSSGLNESINLSKSSGITQGFAGGVAGGVNLSRTIASSYINQNAENAKFLLSKLAMRYEQGRASGMLLNEMIITAEHQYGLDTTLSLIEGLFRNVGQDILSYREFIYNDEKAVQFFLSYLYNHSAFPMKITDEKTAYDGELHKLKYSIPITNDEAAILFTPSLEEMPGLEVLRKDIPVFYQEFDMKEYEYEDFIELGKIVWQDKVTGRLFGFDYNQEFHLLVAGGTGFGKTITVIKIIRQLYDRGNKIFGIDPKGSGDYSKLINLCKDQGKRLLFFSFERDDNGQAIFGPLMINPLKPLTVNGKFVSTERWRDLFIDCFVGAYGLRDRSKATLRDELSKLYGLVPGDHPYGHRCEGNDWPHLSELLDLLYVRFQLWKFELKEFHEAEHVMGIITRLKYLLFELGDCFNTDKSIDIEILYRKDTCPIIEIDALSPLDKSFITTFLLQGLYEYYSQLRKKEEYKGELIPDNFFVYCLIDEIHELVQQKSDDAAVDLQMNMIKHLFTEARDKNIRMIPMCQSASELYKAVPLALNNCYTQIILRQLTTDDVDVLAGTWGKKDRASEYTGMEPEKVQYLRRLWSKSGQAYVAGKKKLLHAGLIKLQYKDEPYLIDIDAELEVAAKVFSKRERTKKTNKFIKDEIGDVKVLQTDLLRSSAMNGMMEGYTPHYKLNFIHSEKRPIKTSTEKIEIQEDLDFLHVVKKAISWIDKNNPTWFQLLHAISDNNDDIESIKTHKSCDGLDDNRINKILDNIIDNPLYHKPLIIKTENEGREIYQLTEFGDEIIRIYLNLSKEDYYKDRKIVNLDERYIEDKGEVIQDILSTTILEGNEIKKEIKEKIDSVKYTLSIKKQKNPELELTILEGALKDAESIKDKQLIGEIESIINSIRSSKHHILKYVISHFDDYKGIVPFTPKVENLNDNDFIDENKIPGITKKELIETLDDIYRKTADKKSIKKRKREGIIESIHDGVDIKYKYLSLTVVSPNENERDEFGIIMIIMDYDASRDLQDKVDLILGEITPENIVTGQNMSEIFKKLNELEKK